MAISAVSRSRISPTMMMSGSCRRMDRSAAANVSPILGFTGICVTPATWYSTGSSTVTILTPGWFSRSSAPYSVVVFPEPVGPVTRRMPCGWRMRCSNWSSTGPGMPSSARSRTPAPRSSTRSTTLSPCRVGVIDTRMSSSRSERGDHHALAVGGGCDRPGYVDLGVGEPRGDAAFWGQPPLRVVQPRHDLHAADDRGLVLARRVRDLLQHAVDAVPHAQPVRARLEMHIARPRPQRLEDQDVDELDHRGLVGEGAQIVDRLFFVGEHDEIAAAEVARLELGRRLRLGREDRSVDLGSWRRDEPHLALEGPAELVDHRRIERQARRDDQRATLGDREGQQTDRKSTRLNSSHLVISYAVFCLKKKKKKKK